MDPMDPNEIQEVRKIIESSTSKVSLRDLEKKGFRKVKVLRSNDIDDLIRRAVTAVVAREGHDAKISEEIVQRSRQELKSLMGQAQAAERERQELINFNETLEGNVKELQRRLADEEETRHRAEARLRAVEREGGGRTEETDALRYKVKQLETERRLVEELEVPKLRGRIKELEDELRISKAAAAVPHHKGMSDEQMRAMFRDVLKESGGVGAAAGMGAEFKAEFAKLQNSIAQSFATAGGRGEQITEADIAAAKVSIEALFKHDVATAVQSNIGDIKIKESTITSDLKSKLDRLKALRKAGGGSS